MFTELGNTKRNEDQPNTTDSKYMYVPKAINTYGSFHSPLLPLAVVITCPANYTLFRRGIPFSYSIEAFSFGRLPSLVQHGLSARYCLAGSRPKVNHGFAFGTRCGRFLQEDQMATQL